MRAAICFLCVEFCVLFKYLFFTDGFCIRLQRQVLCGRVYHLGISIKGKYAAMRIKRPLYLAGVLALSLAFLAGCSKKGNRTDAQVAIDVQTKIYSDNGIQSRQISVQAVDGVVTLSGDVN